MWLRLLLYFRWTILKLFDGIYRSDTAPVVSNWLGYVINYILSKENNFAKCQKVIKIWMQFMRLYIYV